MLTDTRHMVTCVFPGQGIMRKILVFTSFAGVFFNFCFLGGLNLSMLVLWLLPLWKASWRHKSGESPTIGLLLHIIFFSKIAVAFYILGEDQVERNMDSVFFY